MKKTELVAAIVAQGIATEAKAKRLKVAELEALLNRKPSLPAEDGFAVIAAEQAKEEVTVAVLPNVPTTPATPSKVETPKKVKYVKLFTDGKKICEKRGLNIIRLTKDWNKFSNLVNDTVGKRAPGFKVLFKTMVAKGTEWYALVTVERKVKDTKLQNQFTCLLKGDKVDGKVCLGEVEYLKW